MIESNTIYAPKTGLYLPGTSGNYVSTPDHADLDITGDISITIDLNYSVVPTTGIVPLVSKFGISGNRSYYFRLFDNRMEWFMSPDATAVYIYSCGMTLPSNYYSLGVTRKKSDGVIKFWLKDCFNSSWVQQGSAITGTTSDIFISTTIIELGQVAFTYHRTLLLYSAQIYDGIGDNSQPGLGTLVAEADFSYPWTNDKYRDKTGKIWTINGSAWAWEYQDDPSERYDSPDIIYGGDAHSLIPDTVGGATASSLPTHIYEGDVI